jgi:hypothetical protein
VTAAWLGSIAGPDHLYPTCPALARTKPWGDGWPRPCSADVDPDGTDLCGWCVRVWHARHEATT